jgi:serine/threonine protein kinase
MGGTPSLPCHSLRLTRLQSRGRPLSEQHARFYVASVIMALGYLHERHLVYR